MKSNCWYCGTELVWKCDFDLNSTLGDGEGIITHLECPGCGAEVEYINRVTAEI